MANRNVKIDPKIKLQKIQPLPDQTYKCSCCGKEYDKQEGNFYKTRSVLYQGNGGYLTFCKNCVDTYFQQLVGFYSGDERNAVEHCCRIFDWYYNEFAFNKARDAKSARSLISAYSAKSNMSQVLDKGTTYLDTLRENHDAKILENPTQNIANSFENGDNYAGIPDEELQELIVFFGGGYKNEEYKFLQDQYEDWKTRYECQTKAQEELFKSLSIVQLAIQNAQKQGQYKTVIDLMKTFQDLLGSANLKPAQITEVSNDECTFGTLIKTLEDERPVPEVAEEFKDVDNIYKYIDTYFLGHLCNLVHVKNDHEAEYKKEMAKYTVTPPQYEEDAIAETSLLDKYSDKGDDTNGGE